MDKFIKTWSLVVYQFGSKPVGDPKSELQFNTKIKIKAIIQKHWVKLTDTT